ncbi:MAG: hypothetical protein WBQ34_15870 [Candidatus Acidiferrales bacterium]
MTDRNQKILAFAGGGIIAIILLPLLDHLGRIELFFPILGTVAVIVGVVSLSWELRRRPWYWVTMILVVALHVPVILYVPWRAGWIPAPVTIAVCMVDLLIVVRVLKLIGRFVDRTKSPA